MKPDPEKRIDLLYRRLASQEWRPLLEDMLCELKFTSECKDEGDRALNNYAKRLVVKVFANEEDEVPSVSFFEMVRRLVKRKREKQDG